MALCRTCNRRNAIKGRDLCQSCERRQVHGPIHAPTCSACRDAGWVRVDRWHSVPCRDCKREVLQDA